MSSVLTHLFHTLIICDFWLVWILLLYSSIIISWFSPIFFDPADSPGHHLDPLPQGHEGEAKEEAEAATKLSHQGGPGQTF